MIKIAVSKDPSKFSPRALYPLPDSGLSKYFDSNAVSLVSCIKMMEKTLVDYRIRSIFVAL